MAINKFKPNLKQAFKQDIYIYQRKVRSMLYAANITQFNVIKTVSKLLKFSQNPLLIYDATATKTIAHFYQTKTFAIKYSNKNVKNYIFAKASDTAFKNNLVSRKSTEGYLFTLYGGPIDWRSAKQKFVTKLSTEAELLGLSHAATKLIWWQ